MNKPDINVAKKILLPKRGDSLDNLAGYPQKFKLPLMEDISGKYINFMQLFIKPKENIENFVQNKKDVMFFFKQVTP